MRKRGHFLLAAIVLVGFIGLTLVLAARHFNSITVRTRQTQLETEVAQLASAARNWADANAEKLISLEPEKTIELDPSVLLGATSSGSLRITRLEATDGPSDENQTQPTFDIAARIESGRHIAMIHVAMTLGEKGKRPPTD